MLAFRRSTERDVVPAAPTSERHSVRLIDGQRQLRQMDVLAVCCFNAGWLAGVIQSQGVGDTASCRALNVFAGGATCSSRVMAAVATARQGTKRLDGLPSRQPMQALLGCICGTSRPTNRTRTTQENDNDDGDVKLSKARDNPNRW